MLARRRLGAGALVPRTSANETVRVGMKRCLVGGFLPHDEVRASRCSTVSRRALSVIWYRFSATFGRRWTGYLTIVLLVGLVGGIAMGSVAAARRTESSYPTFLASTNPSDMSVLLGVPNETAEFSRLPLVRRVATADFEWNAFPQGPNGAPLVPPALASGEVAGVGNLEGEYFSQDKVAVTDGRMADPRKADEFVMTADAERLMGWHVGQVIRMYFYTNAQTQLPNYGTAKVKPHLRLAMRLVGTVVLNEEVVLDEVDRYPALMIFTPALTRRFAGPGPLYIDYGLQLDHGARDVPTVEEEIIHALPRGTTYSFHVTSLVTGQVDRSVQPEAIALGVFGLIAALAALIIAGGLIVRVLSRVMATISKSCVPSAPTRR